MFEIRDMATGALVSSSEKQPVRVEYGQVMTVSYGTPTRDEIIAGLSSDIARLTVVRDKILNMDTDIEANDFISLEGIDGNRFLNGKGNQDN